MNKEAEDINEAIKAAREYEAQFATLHETDNAFVAGLIKRYGLPLPGVDFKPGSYAQAEDRRKR